MDPIEIPLHDGGHGESFLEHQHMETPYNLFPTDACYLGNPVQGDFVYAASSYGLINEQ